MRRLISRIWLGFFGLVVVTLCFASCGLNKKNEEQLSKLNGTIVFNKEFPDSIENEIYRRLLLLPVEEGRIKAYVDTAFNMEWDYDVYFKDNNKIDTALMYNSVTGDFVTVVNRKVFNWDKVVAYRKMLLYYNGKGKKSRETFAIAPMVEVISDGVSIGETQLFWVKIEDTELDK